MRRGFLIQGRVQGVGFRMWISRQASLLQLSGTVRNRSDGAVEVHVEGPDETVRQLEETLWRGPPVARVDSVRQLSSPDHLLPGFRILY
jgi:acylphosphatase